MTDSTRAKVALTIWSVTLFAVIAFFVTDNQNTMRGLLFSLMILLPMSAGALVGLMKR